MKVNLFQAFIKITDNSKNRPNIYAWKREKKNKGTSKIWGLSDRLHTTVKTGVFLRVNIAYKQQSVVKIEIQL